MGGGNLNKPVVYDIMIYETRQLYYLIHNTPIAFQRKIRIINNENENI